MRLIFLSFFIFILSSCGSPDPVNEVSHTTSNPIYRYPLKAPIMPKIFTEEQVSQLRADELEARRDLCTNNLMYYLYHGSGDIDLSPIYLERGKVYFYEKNYPMADQDCTESVRLGNLDAIFFRDLSRVYNPYTKDSRLEYLLDSESERIRRGIVKHGNCTIKMLDKLSYDIQEGVRIEVAKNPKTSKEILDRLSRDHSFNVRQALLLNKNCPDLIKLRVREGFK